MASDRVALLLQDIEAVRAFLECNAGLDTAALAAQQVAPLRAKLTSLGAVSCADAYKLIRAVQSLPWGAEAADELQQQINKQVEAGVTAPEKRPVAKAALQTFCSIEHYLPDAVWDSLQVSDAVACVRAGLKAVADFAVSLGLRRPSERTAQHLTGFVLFGMQVNMPTPAKLAALRDLKKFVRTGCHEPLREEAVWMQSVGARISLFYGIHPHCAFLSI